jgi:hypothetical protein
MQKRLAEITDYLDASRGELLASVSGIDASFAELRPREGVWSVAEIVNHLAIVEARIATLISRSILWGREKAIGSETSESSMLSSLDSFSIIEPTKPRAAPGQISPPADCRLDDGLKSLSVSRRALREALGEGDGMDLAAITRPHPAFGELNLYQWALFVGQHEARHTRQIERADERGCGIGTDFLGEDRC